MPIEVRRGEPTPPIAFGTSREGSRPRRLSGDVAEIPAGLIERLRSACPVVEAPEALDEAGRDWWPLALTWAVAGQVPARPAAIARPGSVAEVAAVLRICNDARVPVTPAGGRSGVCGASIPVHGGVALDLTAMSGITAVDGTSLLIDVGPGTFGDVLEDELRETWGLTLGHWPQSIQLSTVGGWVACRSAGQYSTRYGKIEDMVAGLDVVLADGTAVRTGGRAPRTASGPDLTQVFVGSEGTLGVVTSATLRVWPAPRGDQRSAWGFASFAAGLDACRRVLRRGVTPAVLRLYDVIESTRTFSLDTNALIVLDEGDPEDVTTTMQIVAAECAATPDTARLEDGLVEHWLGHRNDVSSLPTLVSGGIVLDTVEVAARWSTLPQLYLEALAALRPLEGMLAASAHQSHAYPDGACLYFTWASRLPAGAVPGGPEADEVYRRAWDAVTGVTLRLGGALSHHHGVGLNRGRYLAEALGPGATGVLGAIKAALDPRGILNPGKLGLPSPLGPSHLAVNIDWHAAKAGALADLGVLAPVVGVYTALHATGVISGDAGVIVTAVIGVFVAPLVGGAVAARSASTVPLTNATVATALGVSVYLVFRVVDAIVRNRPLSPGSAVILAMLSVLMGVIGGLVASRIRRR